jgi:hypothetical protein
MRSRRSHARGNAATAAAAIETRKAALDYIAPYVRPYRRRICRAFRKRSRGCDASADTKSLVAQRPADRLRRYFLAGGAANCGKQSSHTRGTRTPAFLSSPAGLAHARCTRPNPKGSSRSGPARDETSGPARGEDSCRRISDI